MAGKRYYSNDDPEVGVTPSQLKRLGRQRQRDYVLAWFGRNFEDPAQETPYNGQEGGYQYIWGGPYDAREELWSEFEGILSEERIEELADEVESDGITDWAPGPAHPDHARAADERMAEDETGASFHAPPGQAILVDDDGSYLTDADGSILTEPIGGDIFDTPDFSQIVRDIEGGAAPDFGSVGELRGRQALRDQIARLEAELAHLRPTHGGMGHNNPPPDEGSIALSAVLDEVRAISAGMALALDQAKPDAPVVASSASRLQKLGRWLAGKGDLIAEEFSKAFGKSLGAAAGEALVSGVLIAAIAPVLHAAAAWLHTLAWPF